jgi:hypothetical protein
VLTRQSIFRDNRSHANDDSENQKRSTANRLTHIHLATVQSGQTRSHNGLFNPHDHLSSYWHFTTHSATSSKLGVIRCLKWPGFSRLVETVRDHGRKTDVQTKRLSHFPVVFDVLDNAIFVRVC